MKVLKRPHRSGSVRITPNKSSPASATQSEEIAATLLPPASTAKATKSHPLSDVLGTFGGEAWEEHRAMLLKLRQADAEDETLE